MVSGSPLKPRDVSEIRRELAPFVTTLRRLSQRYGIAVSTLIKHASLPDPIDVRPVRVEGLDDWNARIGQ